MSVHALKRTADIESIVAESQIDKVNDINFEYELERALTRLRTMMSRDLTRNQKAILRAKTRESLIYQCLDAKYVDAMINEYLGSDEKKTEGDDGLVVTLMTDIAIEPIKWLWPDRFARGVISIVAGVPDCGKTTMCLDIAARVTRGEKWPDNSGIAQKGGVLIMSAEDDPARTLKPRFLAAGGNPNFASIIEAVRLKNKRRPFSLSTDVEHLLDLCKQQKPSLIIIDPLSAYLGRVDSHKNAEVRAALTPLAEMAIKSDVAIILISHLNKGGLDQDALSRITGSLGFVAAARSVYLVAKDKDDKDRKLLLPVKNNLAKTKTGLAYRIENRHVEGEVYGVRPLWEPDPIEDMSADEALRQSHDKEINESLIDFINRKGGSVTPRDVQKSGRATTTEDAETMLRGLASSGLGRVETKETTSKGGRPTIHFVLTDETDTTDTTRVTPDENEVSSVLGVSSVSSDKETPI